MSRLIDCSVGVCRGHGARDPIQSSLPRFLPESEEHSEDGVS